MKKLFVLILLLGLIGGCAYEQRIAVLESQVAPFKKPSAMLLAEQAGSSGIARLIPLTIGWIQDIVDRGR